MPNSTPKAKIAKPAKPRPGFPLFPRANDRWTKKILRRFVYFGKHSGDRESKAAINLWLDQKDDLLAGRTPRVSRDTLTFSDHAVCSLTARELQRDAGDIVSRSFADYIATCKAVVDAFGKNRPVDDLSADDS